MSWTGIIHLGDLPLTLSVGGAIAAWLAAGGEWRAAVRWLLAFGLALGIVGASKIAYLGWATGIPALRFEALSGHAAGFAATFAMLCHLLARRARPALRRLAACAAVAATIALAAALVLGGHHTPWEAAAGWLVGMAAPLATIRALQAAPPRAAGGAAAGAVLAFALCAGLAVHLPVGYWMIKAARILSGNPRTTPWAQHTGQTEFPTPSDRRQACAVPPHFVSPGSDRASLTPHRRIRC